MAQAALRHFVFSLGACALLIGCVDGAGPGTGTSTDAPAPVRLGAARDVEAPEIFQATDSALWDGRPSLGGIWVASADVQDPQRVVMFNPATGKTVQGALFRRERDNPGPPLQISSDAAEALGILAGQPVEIQVTALRRDEPADPAADAADPAPEAASPEETSGGETGEEIAETAADPAAAPVDEATAAAATAMLAATGAVDATAVDPALDAAASAPVDATPKRKTWKERRAEAKAAREARKAAAAAAAAPVADPNAVAEVPATPEAVDVTPIETAPLDARAPDVAAEAEAAAVVEPPKTRRQRRAEAEAAEAAAAAAATAVVTAPVAPEAPASAGRLIQIASFTKEENASRAVAALSKIGVAAEARKSETGGKIVWGVIARGDAALLASIKSAGFADAFFLQ